MKDPIDDLLALWRYLVPIFNAATGEKRTMMVRLEPDEQSEALMALLTNWPNGGSHSESVAGYYASVHALSGLGEEWAVEPSEIQRIKALH
jgi:hypothetical protein